MAEFSSTVEGEVVKSSDFSKKSLEGRLFTSCTFQSCNFSETLLRGAQFASCRFVGCNLSLVKLQGCRFQEAEFIDCKIVGAEFAKCEKTFFSASFKNCLIHYCNFSDLSMKNATFTGSRVKECHFTNTVLSGADFSGVDLSGTIFHHSDLCKADFSTATQYVIDPQTNKIKKASFSLPEALGLLQGFGVTII